MNEYDSSTENLTNSSRVDAVFDGCSKLVGGNGMVYDKNYIDKTYARIDTAENPGYLTKKE